MPDINLDVPNAYTLLERFGEMCHKDKVMSYNTYKDLPRGWVLLYFQLDLIQWGGLVYWSHHTVCLLVNCLKLLPQYSSH